MAKKYNIVTASRSASRHCDIFSGRATRAEFWWFKLACFILGSVFDLCVRNALMYDLQIIKILSSFCLVVLGLLSISVAGRRLHDTGRSAWNLLLSFLPIIGWIILLVYYCQDSQVGANQYGESEKYPNL